jgi:hypothetical protein
LLPIDNQLPKAEADELIGHAPDAVAGIICYQQCTLLSDIFQIEVP